MRIKQYTSHDFSGDAIKTKKFELDPQSMKLAVEFFSQYKDPIGSIVREVTTNCADSRKEMWDYKTGTVEQLRSWYPNLEKLSDASIMKLKTYFQKKQDKPVEVRLEGLSSLDSHPTIVFRDWGVGISPSRAENVYSNYFASTKRMTNTQMGAWGLGAKSPLGYIEIFSVDTVFNGKRYEYIIRATESSPDFDLYSVTDTDEENNTVVMVSIKDGDLGAFQKAISEQLAYFDDLRFINCGLEGDYEIYRGEHFIYRSNTPFTEMHLCLGNVYYPISFYTMNWAYQSGRNCPIGLLFSMDEVEKLTIMKTREDLTYDFDTVQCIRDKYDLAKEELTDLVNEADEPIQDLLEYYDAIHQDTRKVQIYPGVSVAGLDDLVTVEKIKLAGYDNLKKIPDNPFDLFFKLKAKLGPAGKRKLQQRDLQLKRYIMGESTWFRPYYRCKPETLLSGQKNRYLARLNNCLLVSTRLIFDFQDEAIKTNGVLLNYFGLGSQDEMTDAQLLEIRAFAKSVESIVTDRLTMYEDQTVDLLWVEEEKKESKALRTQRKGSITIKDIYQNDRYNVRMGQAPLKWSMDRFEINYWINTVQKGRSSSLIIYGYQSDEPMLFAAASIIFHQKNLHHSHYNHVLDAKKISIYKIAVGNTHVMEQLENTIHVNDFLSLTRGASIIRRSMTAHRLNIIMGPQLARLLHPNLMKVNPSLYIIINRLHSYIQSNTSNPRGAIKVNEELVEFFNDYERKRRKMIARAKRFNKPMPRLEPAYDYAIIELAQEVSSHLDKYSLLPWLDFDVIPSEVLENYFGSLSPINSRLLKRFKAHVRTKAKVLGK